MRAFKDNAEMLVPINDYEALTGHIRDPARVLLLHRDKDSASTFPISHSLASFSVSATLNATVNFEVVINATSNLGKYLKSNVMIDVHRMQDNFKTFNYEDSVKKVYSRYVCQHPLVPLGFSFLHYQASDNAKETVKVLRVACTVDVKAVTTPFQPVPLYFVADLYPFLLPSDHAMLTYAASVKSAMTNPFDFYRPLDHLIPLVNVGDFLYIKVIPECLHLACVKSHTDDPFRVIVLLELLFKPVGFDGTCYGAHEAAKSIFSGAVLSDESGESQVPGTVNELNALSFVEGEVTEVCLNLSKDFTLGKTLFLVLTHQENMHLNEHHVIQFHAFLFFLLSSGRT